MLERWLIRLNLLDPTLTDINCCWLFIPLYIVYIYIYHNKNTQGNLSCLLADLERGYMDCTPPSLLFKIAKNGEKRKKNKVEGKEGKWDGRESD